MVTGLRPPSQASGTRSSECGKPVYHSDRCPWPDRLCCPRLIQVHGLRPAMFLARIPLESAKQGIIPAGLPRVAELFEARRPKDHAIIAKKSAGTIRFGRDYRNKRRIVIEPAE